MAIKINVLNKGDTVIDINERFVSVRRKNGEVDLIPFIIDDGTLRLDTSNTITISYGNNTVEYSSEDSDTVTITF